MTKSIRSVILSCPRNLSNSAERLISLIAVAYRKQVPRPRRRFPAATLKSSIGTIQNLTRSLTKPEKSATQNGESVDVTPACCSIADYSSLLKQIQPSSEPVPHLRVDSNGLVAASDDRPCAYGSPWHALESSVLLYEYGGRQRISLIEVAR